MNHENVLDFFEFPNNLFYLTGNKSSKFHRNAGELCRNNYEYNMGFFQVQGNKMHFSYLK